MTDRKDHWEKAWQSGEPSGKSWFQDHSTLSLELIMGAGIPYDAPLIDIGGGASGLVDSLLDAGFTDLTVMDISASALQHCRARLGARAGKVQWLEADITRFDPPRRWALWHDRAVFHFLTEAPDREAYKRALNKGIGEQGSLVIATFAEDGPEKCSGLNVVRYSPKAIEAEFAPQFELREYRREQHQTPMGTLQQFGYYRFRKSG